MFKLDDRQTLKAWDTAVEIFRWEQTHKFSHRGLTPFESKCLQKLRQKELKFPVLVGHGA